MVVSSMLSKSSCFMAGLIAISVLFGCAETRSLAPPPAPALPPPSLAPVVQMRPASDWSINNEAINLIKQAEGLRLRAYHLAGQILIGYGHAVADDEDATSDDENLSISADQAQKFLRDDLSSCESAARRSLKVDVTNNQFSALVAFCYNVGQATFANSSVLRHLNEGDTASAADAFLLYDKTTLDTGKRSVAVLTERRIKERYLFLAS